MDSARRAVLLTLAAALVVANVAVLATHDFDTKHETAAVTSTTTTTLPGTQFTARDGKYTLRVDPAWPHHSDQPLQGFESWELTAAMNGAISNMNVLVENLPAALTLEQYVDASKTNLPKLMATAAIVSSQIVNGVFGQRLGMLEYQATLNGLPLHFVAVMSVSGKHAAVLTLGARAEEFAQVRAALDPYLLTLQAK